MKFVFKFQFVVGLLLFACINVQAADDLITKQITIKLDKAGTLPDRIGSTRKYLVTNLKIVGEINGTDLCLIRDMAGSDYLGKNTDGHLAILDLSEARIVKGGEFYYCHYIFGGFYTYDDVIGDYGFYGCSSLTNITIPSSVTLIGYWAFEGCSSLTSVTISSNVTSIDDDAFYGCRGINECNYIITTSLESYISLGNNLDKVPCANIRYIFEGVEITNLEIPSSVTSIGNRAFYGCCGLTNVTIPSSVTSIGSSAFEYCRGLTNITIPSSVTSIENDVFYGCRGLTNITIPSSVTLIGSSAFKYCRGLTNITIPSSVTLIGSSAFYGCSGLTSVTIPSSVTSIRDCAFYGCSGLINITISSSVTSIGSSAFEGCSGLKSVYVSSEVPAKLKDSVFSGIDKETCILYVPRGSYDDYFLSPWGDYFDKIVEYDPTGIDKVTTSIGVKEVSRYSVNGQRLDAPTKGLNIVKFSDGSVKKVMVQ